MTRIQVGSIVVCIAIATLIAGYAVLDTDITLRSSDGKWADTEDGFNGRTFESLVFNFESYKLKCAAPKAVLLRATCQNWIDVFAWPSYLRDRKWRVPYSDAHPEIGGYFPLATQKGCYNEGWSPEVAKAAQSNADRYPSHL